MATYFIDSSKTGGANDGSSWPDAWLSIGDAKIDVASFSAGDIVYVASGSVDTYTYGASFTLVGPSASANPVSFISVTTGTTTYAKATSNQIDLQQDGSRTLTLDGSFYFHGIQMYPGNTLAPTIINYENIRFDDCKIRLDHTKQITVSGSYGTTTFRNCEIEHNDSIATGAVVIQQNGIGMVELQDCLFSNGSNRTGHIISTANQHSVIISGCDFSSYTNATACELISLSAANGVINITNCKIPATHTFFLVTGTLKENYQYTIQRTANGTDPTQLDYKTYYGEVISSTSEYRDSGATVEGTAVGWQITTSVWCTASAPFKTPWIYANVSAATYTVDCYITHNTVPTADFTDTEVWLEVEYNGNATSDKWETKTDRNTGNPLAAGTAQTDDAASTWTGITEVFMQKLSVGSVVVSTAGLLRARVVFAFASITSGAACYVDPLITVT